MQAGGGHGDDHVVFPHPVRAQQLVGLHHAHGGGGHIVLPRLHDPRMLRGLPAQEGAPGLHAALGNAGHNIGHMLGHHLADGDIVLQKQRLRPAHHQVVHAHGHQVDADGVMLAHSLGDRQFRAHPIGAGGQQRLTVVTQGKQPGESAQTAPNLRPGGLLGQGGK